MTALSRSSALHKTQPDVIRDRVRTHECILLMQVSLQFVLSYDFFICYICGVLESEACESQHGIPLTNRMTAGSTRLEFSVKVTL